MSTQKKKSASDEANSIISAIAEKTLPVEAKWMNYQVAAHYSGLSAALIEDLALSGEIVTANVVRTGATRGRRLVSRESLDAFIEAGISRPKAELAMNADKPKEPDQSDPAKIEAADPKRESIIVHRSETEKQIVALLISINDRLATLGASISNNPNRKGRP